MKRLFDQSITTKLLLLFLFVGIITMLTVGIYSFHQARKAINSRTLDQLISVRAVKRQQVEYFFNEKFKNLSSLSRNEHLGRIFNSNSPGLHSPLSRQSLEVLRNYYTAYGFTNLYIVSFRFQPPGIEVADTVAMHGMTVEMLHQINSISKKAMPVDEAIVSDLFFSHPTDSLPICLIAHRVLSDNGNVTGIVIFEISSKDINRIMLQDNRQMGLGNSGETYLLGSDHIMRSASRFINGAVLRVRGQSNAVDNAIHGLTGSIVTTDYRGIKVFSAYEPVRIKGLQWIVLAEIDYAEAMIPVTSLRNDIVLVSLIITILILGFAQIITKMITQPLIQLKKAATLLGNGDFSHEVKVTSGDEIGLLAATFNTMTARIKEEREKRIQALFDGQEMERQRFSRELHDGLGQKLIGAKLQLENCTETDITSLKTITTDVKNSLHSIVDELRRISNDLMPAALEELGMETALKNLCSDVEHQTNIEAEFDSGLSALIKGKTAVYIFRIAQEGIQNIIKHSHASRFSLQLIRNKDVLILILEDNGDGFEVVTPAKGNGLSNMKERALLLGGSFTIESKPGKGTTIRVKIPLTNDPPH